MHVNKKNEHVTKKKWAVGVEWEILGMAIFSYLKETQKNLWNVICLLGTLENSPEFCDFLVEMQFL